MRSEKGSGGSTPTTTTGLVDSKIRGDDGGLARVRVRVHHCESTTLLELVMARTWKCLGETPFRQKNVLFGRFFKSQADLEDLAVTSSLSFAPGLLDMMKSATPPTIESFRSLPVPLRPYRQIGLSYDGVSTRSS